MSTHIREIEQWPISKAWQGVCLRWLGHMAIDEILVPASNDELHEKQKPLSDVCRRIEHERRSSAWSEHFKKPADWCARKESWVRAIGIDKMEGVSAPVW